MLYNRTIQLFEKCRGAYYLHFLCLTFEARNLNMLKRWTYFFYALFIIFYSWKRNLLRTKYRRKKSMLLFYLWSRFDSLQFDSPEFPLLKQPTFNLIGAFCAWQQTVLMNRPISLLIKRSKGLSEVVKGKHSAHRLNRCMIGYVQYPDTLIVTGVGISAGAVFFYFYLCIQEILIYVMSWLWMCASLLKFSF